MAQNRAAARDRLMARHDYEVNLKAEIEIAALHAKIDEIRSTELRLLCDRLETVPDKRRPDQPAPGADGLRGSRATISPTDRTRSAGGVATPKAPRSA
jgi:uncharacterized membrane protein